MSIVNGIFKGLGELLKAWINNVLVTCLGFLNEITFDFWNNYIITGFLSFSMWINGIVFALGFLFSLFDAAEEAVSMKQIDWLAVSMNFIKGILFVNMYSYLAIGIMQSANILTEALNLKITTDKENLISSIAMGASGVATSLIMSIFVIIGIICFLAISLKRYGTMLIQIFSSAFYVPDIVRGETTKLGDWLRQTIAIACTYTFQYILFYIGFILLLERKGLVNTLIALGLWMAMGGVSQVLSKYGYSSGIKGGSTIASMASQGLQLLTKH